MYIYTKRAINMKIREVLRIGDVEVSDKPFGKYQDAPEYTGDENVIDVIGGYSYGIVKVRSDFYSVFVRDGDTIAVILDLNKWGDGKWGVIMVKARPAYGSKGLATALYLWAAKELVGSGGAIMSDSAQSPAARRLWVKIWEAAKSSGKWEVVGYNSDDESEFEVKPASGGRELESASDESPEIYRNYSDRRRYGMFLALKRRGDSLNEIWATDKVVTRDSQFEFYQNQPVFQNAKMTRVGKWDYGIVDEDDDMPTVFARDGKKVIGVLEVEKLYANVYGVTMSMVREGYGRQGIATALYFWAIKGLMRGKAVLLSDSIQSTDSQGLWIKIWEAARSSGKWEVVGFDRQRGKSFEVKPVGGHLDRADSDSGPSIYDRGVRGSKANSVYIHLALKGRNTEMK
jgi:hypothetical protein